MPAFTPAPLLCAPALALPAAAVGLLVPCSPNTWSENTNVTKLSRTKDDMVPHVGSGLSRALAKWAHARMPCCSAASSLLLLPPAAAAARSLHEAMASRLPSQVHLMALWVSQAMLGLTLNRERSSSRLNVRTCSHDRNRHVCATP